MAYLLTVVRAYLYMARVDAPSQLPAEQVAVLRASIDALVEAFVRDLGYGFHEVAVGESKTMEDLGNLEIEA